jgi:serine/threonine protein kinase/tetratricopeptide (TPR) repeat protein
MQEQTLFIEALEQNDPAQRAAFLDRACAGDPALRRRIERLLRRHQQADSLLDTPAAALPATVHEAVREGPGSMIGPYRLLAQIGEGGFGVVFRAEQTQPVRREVALKVVKAGMDTRQVVARFEAERQALALMDHPHIAQVFDGGATASGRPYFVMELVKGVPITDFCDQNRLAVRERLALFVSVCQAVQHAHQKGVIHRDLKPSNVLVTRHDGTPAVKVIDFGVAKATGRQLTESTLTSCGAPLIGTPLYMSPEQTRLSGLDVDTRTDIYALGVLLYELLTGTTPLDTDRLRALGFDEVLRLIRDEQPARPSTRVGTLGPAAPAVAANRRSDPKRLGELLRGEPDWIVMRALEKDRDRRYETASAFAADVQRYLNDEPVVACPPSAGYRLRKFLRRNKGPVLAMGVIVLSLVAGIVGTTAGLVRALEAERQALKDRDEKEAARRRAVAAAAAEMRARQALNLLTDTVVEEMLERQVHITGWQREYLKKVLAYHAEFGAARSDSPEGRQAAAESSFRVSRIRTFLGELQGAESALRDALTLYKQLAADFPGRADLRRELAKGHNSLGMLLLAAGRPKEAESALRDALVVRRELAAEYSSRSDFRQELARSQSNLGKVLRAAGRPKEAESAYHEARVLFRRLAARFPARADYRQDLARCDNLRGDLLHALGRSEEAESAHRAALVVRLKLVADFPTRADFRRELALSHNNLGVWWYAAGRLEAAESAYRAALILYQQLAADFPASADYQNNLAVTLGNLAQLHCKRQEFAAAVPLLEQARPHHQAALKDNPKNPNYRQFYRNSLVVLAESRLRLADHARAATTAGELARFGIDRAADTYSAACCLCRCVTLAETDARIDEARRRELAQTYADRALALLRQAVASGHRDAARMRTEPALGPLRCRAEFNQLLSDLGGKTKE